MRNQSGELDVVSLVVTMVVHWFSLFSTSMAPVSSLASSPLRSSSSNGLLALTLRGSSSSTTPNNKTGKHPVAAFRCDYESNCGSQPEQKEKASCSTPEQEPFQTNPHHFKRRHLLTAAALLTFSPHQQLLPQALALAQNQNNYDSADDFRLYTDDSNRFKLLIPQEWEVGAGEPNGFKSVTAFYPQETSSSSVSVVITGLGADYTRMESFGKVEEFADTLVSGLDRSWQRPPGVAAKLIDCKSANGFYYIKYTLQSPGESCRFLSTTIGMASNGWYNRLYTVTGQFFEEDSEKYSSKIQKVVSSFSFI